MDVLSAVAVSRKRCHWREEIEILRSLELLIIGEEIEPANLVILLHKAVRFAAVLYMAGILIVVDEDEDTEDEATEEKPLVKLKAMKGCSR